MFYLQAWADFEKFQFHRAEQAAMFGPNRRYVMLEYITTWIALKTDRRAVTALEYGLIAGLIAVVIIGVLTTMGSGLNTKFGLISTALTK